MQRNARYALFLILALALVPRLFSLTWNAVPHGDTEMDVRAARAIAAQGNLVIGEFARVEGPAYLYPPERTGYKELLIQHPPLWAALGAAVSAAAGIDAYLALRILSVVAGMAVIVLASRFARIFVNEAAAIAVSAWLAASYLMIDFSGNGSLYMVQAGLYVVWLWTAVAGGVVGKQGTRAVLFGVLAGAGYLLNYQMIILLPASVILLLPGNGTVAAKLARILVCAAVASLIVLPWFVRSAAVYGDPFFHQYWNLTYLYNKAGLEKIFEGNVYRYELDAVQKASLLADMVLEWLPNNLYYAARKLFILAPVAFVVFCYGLIDYAFSLKRLRRVFPVLLLLALHSAISTLWPVVKFRYFAPMLPLVFLLALEHLYAVRLSERVRRILIDATLACIIVLSFFTYRAIPTHTYYFNGAITTDPFGGSEEMRFVESHGLIAPATPKGTGPLQPAVPPKGPVPIQP